jgi:hypothetical protein
MASAKAVRRTTAATNKKKNIVIASILLLSIGRTAAACSDDKQNNVEPPKPTPTNDATPDGPTKPLEPFDGNFNTQPDSGDAGPPCDITKDYGAPVLITSPKELFSVRFVKNEGLAYVTAACGLACATGKDVFTTIIKASTTLDTPLPVPSASTAGNDESATLTNDGKTLVMATSDTLDASEQKHLVRYVDPGTGTFQVDTASLVPASPAAADVQPYLLPDQTLYFATNRLVRNQTYQVFRAARTATGYDEPVSVTNVNLGGTDQQFPVATADDQVIYFSTARAPTLGGFDIWKSVRAPGGDFQEPTHVDGFSSAGHDAVTWVSPDTCNLYLISDREGSRKLYRASRPPK